MTHIETEKLQAITAMPAFMKCLHYKLKTNCCNVQNYITWKKVQRHKCFILNIFYVPSEGRPPRDAIYQPQLVLDILSAAMEISAKKKRTSFRDVIFHACLAVNLQKCT